MPVVVKCDCGKQLRVPDEHRGKRFKCPGCGASLVAGESAPAPTPTKKPDAPAAGVIPFACKCGKKLQVKAEHAGKALKCPQCGEALKVPTPGGPAPARKAAPPPVKEPEPTPPDDDADNPDDPPVSKRLDQMLAKKKAATARQEAEDEEEEAAASDPDDDDTDTDEEEQPKKGKGKKGKKKGGSMLPLLLVALLALGGGGAAAWYFDPFGLFGDGGVNKPIKPPVGSGNQTQHPVPPPAGGDFALVPANAGAFATLRVADLLATDLGKEVLALLPPEGQNVLALGEGKLGLSRNDIQRVTVVVPSVEEAVAAAMNAGPGGPETPPEAYAIITTSKPLDPHKILHWPELKDAVAAEHNGKQLHTLGPVAFSFHSDTVAIVGTPSAVRKAIDQGMQPVTDGPLAALLTQAEQPHVFLGGIPPAAHMAQFKMQMPEQFKPLLELQALQLTGNIEGNTVKLALTGGFGTDANAGQAKVALENLKNWAVQQPQFKADLPAELQEAAKGLTVSQDSSNATITGSVPVDVKVITARLKDGANKTISSNNLKQIGIAMHAYHDAHRGLPPGVIRDAEGKPLHSWRVAILPYIEQENLYRQLKLDEPWDSEHNRKFHNMMPKTFEIPGRSAPEGQTYYQGFAGPGAVFDPERKDRLSLVQIKDGTSNTLVVVEAATPVNWMEPKDIPFMPGPNGFDPAGKVGGAFSGGFHAMRGDASVGFLPMSLPPATLQALITVSGGEMVQEPGRGEVPPPPPTPEPPRRR